MDKEMGYVTQIAHNYREVRQAWTRHEEPLML